MIHQGLPIAVIIVPIGEDNRFGIYWQAVQDYGYLRDKDIENSFCTFNEYRKIISDYAFEFNNDTFMHSIKPEGSVCYAMKPNAFVISSDGKIKKCTCDLEDPRNEFGSLGDELDIDKLNCWLAREITSQSKCYKCKQRPACHFRACRKVESCPPNLYFSNEIIRQMAERLRIGFIDEEYVDE